MLRTHTCGELTAKNIKKIVTIAGWLHRRRDHGGLIFLDLRDRYGLTQVVFNPETASEIFKIADKTGREWVLQVTGEVSKRPEGMINSKLATGEIEINATGLKILNKSQTPPFEIETSGHGKDCNEDLRLKYRYLDLRRERMQKNLKLRADMMKTIRNFFSGEGFIEIETPILVKGTPEGAREYLVPSRLYAGKFYVLPQSPQQLKQLLMVSGMDKYFQIARCFRDEDQRGDRQPEFTQFEIEMSFVEEDDVMDKIENCFLELTKKHITGKKFPEKFPRITWQEAMSKYGSDKPDLRFDLEFINLDKEKKDCGFGIFEKSESLYALPVKKSLGELSRGDIDNLTEIAKIHGAGGLAWLRVGEESGPVAKNSKPEFLKTIIEKCHAENGDLIFFGAGEFRQAVEPLGQVRLALGDKFKLRDPDHFAYCWVYNFPLFEKNSQGETVSMHHPFTRPLEEDLEILDKEPLKARAHAYDIVLNGVELGGGSIRIHEPELQSKMFKLLNISEKDAEARFGHLLQAFKFGAPPHGGIAMGLDRVVMLFTNEPNIREVIAFPKIQVAQDLMLGAPCEMPAAQVAEANVACINLDEETN